MHNVLIRLAAAEKRVKELETGQADLRKAVIDKLEALEDSGDPEAEHTQGDQLISQFLRDLGHKDVADAFDAARQDWWYD